MGRLTHGERRESWERKYDGRHPVWRGPVTTDLAMPPEGWTLELGCGDGKTLRALLDERRLVVGLDFSIKALGSCRKALRKGPIPDLVLGDVLRLPFASASLDVVLAHHVLDHLLLQEREALADEVVRVLRPGGLLDLKAFSIEDMRMGKGGELEPHTFLREGIPYHYFTETEVTSLFHVLLLEEVRTERAQRRYGGRDHQRALVLARFLKRP